MSIWLSLFQTVAIGLWAQHGRLRASREDLPQTRRPRSWDLEAILINRKSTAGQPKNLAVCNRIKAAKVSYNSRHRGSAMKTLGLCFLLVPVILIPRAFAQEQSKNSQISADDAIVQLWNAHSDQTEGARLEGIFSDSDLNACLYLRVYRVKREAKKSDVTVPSGYTTCVPVNRFNKKSTEMPKLQFLPQQ
jgi:hypothetical protein